MTHLRIIISLASLLLAVLPFGRADAGEILDKAPGNPDPDARYVFYLHGQIVQDVGPRPTHPQYGLYDYPLILETLAGRSPGPSDYQDIAIDTGKEHGAFYLPDDAWVLPVVDWIKAAD